MKRILIIFVILLSGLCLVGCKNEKMYRDDMILVMVKSDYKDKFLNKEFTISDFQYENVESFKYGVFFEKDNLGLLSIYLKKGGVREVNKALKHFEKLDFVESVETSGWVTKA